VLFMCRESSQPAHGIETWRRVVMSAVSRLGSSRQTGLYAMSLRFGSRQSKSLMTVLRFPVVMYAYLKLNIFFLYKECSNFISCIKPAVFPVLFHLIQKLNCFFLVYKLARNFIIYNIYLVQGSKQKKTFEQGRLHNIC
jgi:hypothetical protein